MPDNIWYHDYQIVKVNPPIEIEDGMIADLGDLDEFQEFVKTVSFHKKCNFWLHRCWRRMLEKKCVGDNFEMLVTVLAVFVTNILYLLT